MEFTVRRAEAGDAQTLAELNAVSMGYCYSAEKTAHNLKEALNKEYEAVFVADLNGRVVGYVHAAEYGLLFAEKGVNILGVAVAQDFVRMGIGRALISEIEKWAQKRGAYYIRLVSGEARLGAHAFYEKCGFSGNKMQKNFKKKI